MNIIDKNNLLTPQQETLLHDSVSQHFNIGKYQSLDDILTSLRVDVIIEPGIISRSIPSELDNAEAFWREEAARHECSIETAEDRETARRDYEEARRKVEDIKNEKEIWGTMRIRGLYDPRANVIRLYPEEMKGEYKGNCMDELLVSTLAHETMHAYFNRPRHKSFAYVIFVEEPLAEFGMLLYLHESVDSYYEWAYQDVSNKKTCYRYGAKLMDQHLNEGKKSSVQKYLEAYKIKLNNYSMLTIQGDTIELPQKDGRSLPVRIGGKTITPSWENVVKNPPRYFYDRETHTIGFDGYWGDEDRYHHRCIGDVDVDVDMFGHSRIHVDSNLKNVRIYLGDNFSYDEHDYFCDIFYLEFNLSYYFIVSPANKQFYSNNGVLFSRVSNNPVRIV